MRCFFLLAFLLLAVPATAANSAADSSSPNDSRQRQNCGTTVADALKQARLSLAGRNTGSERAALACLIEATSRLEAQKVTATRNGGNPVIAVPGSAIPFNLLPKGKE